MPSVTEYIRTGRLGVRMTTGVKLEGLQPPEALEQSLGFASQAFRDKRKPLPNNGTDSVRIGTVTHTIDAEGGTPTRVSATMENFPDSLTLSSHQNGSTITLERGHHRDPANDRKVELEIEPDGKGQVTFDPPLVHKPSKDDVSAGVDAIQNLATNPTEFSRFPDELLKLFR